MIQRRRFLIGSAAVLVGSSITRAKADIETIKIGQSNPTLGYLPVWAARAFGPFAEQNLELSWALIRGGDPAALAALDSGDIDLAAMGSDTVVDAIAKGQPFQIVYSLMSKLALNMTVSNDFLKRQGVTKDMPLAARVAALKDATFGVAAVGGAQDRTIRWIVAKGGLDPQKDIKIVQVGAAAALGAAMANNRIDGFMLTAPEGEIAEAEGYGQIYIVPDRDVAGFSGTPSLVLAAKKDPDDNTAKKIIRTIRVINAANKTLLSNVDSSVETIRQKYFPKLSSDVMNKSVRSLVDGVKDDGAFSEERARLLIKYVEESGHTAPRQADFWTNKYIEAAQRPN